MKQNLFRLSAYLGNRVHHVFEGFTRELSENRVILNWMYCLAYLALIFYCATNNPLSHNAAIYTTGGIVSTIFTVYVLGTSWEKVAKIKSRMPRMPSEDSGSGTDMSEQDQEDAAGD